jgi:putative N6-adenine-specific DNA methylase
VKEQNFTLLAKTLSGLEEVLAEELTELGVQNPVLGNRAVMFEAGHELIYKVNLWSRLALRFFRLIDQFEFHDNKGLYDGMSRTSWCKLIGIDQTFRIDNTISSDLFHSPLYAVQLAKDAIVDQFRRRFNKRPSIEKENPDYTLLLAIRGTHCSVYLDSTGEALFKRGYRLSTVAAPINEVLAAGILRICGWKPDIPLVDPMCGSGTIPIEAALMGMNIPPGFKRDHFAFMNWSDFDKFAWKKCREGVFRQQKDVALKIYGYDISDRSLDVANENIRSLRMHKDIMLGKADFLELTPPEPNGIVVMNPPYGERLRKENMELFYKNIGDTLKQRFSGYTAWIISSDMDALKSVGLKPASRHTLYNGKLECRLVSYSLY